MKKKEYKKVSPASTVVDMAYQRDLDEPRAQAIAKNFDPDLVGVVVLSRRDDGSLVRIDGQHRFAAACLAGQGDAQFLAEVHSGLSAEEEARLFLRLNGGRSAVRAYDKFKAKLVAKDPAAVAIAEIARKAGLHVGKQHYKNTVCAVDALDAVYRNGNLDTVLRTLKSWAGGDPASFDRILLRGLSAFMMRYPDASPLETADKLTGHAPERVATKMSRTKQTMECSPAIAACIVIRDIYNARRKKGQLPPVDLQREARAVA